MSLPTFSCSVLRKKKVDGDGSSASSSASGAVGSKERIGSRLKIVSNDSSCCAREWTITLAIPDPLLIRFTGAPLLQTQPLNLTSVWRFYGAYFAIYLFCFIYESCCYSALPCLFVVTSHSASTSNLWRLWMQAKTARYWQHYPILASSIP